MFSTFFQIHFGVTELLDKVHLDYVLVVCNMYIFNLRPLLDNYVTILDYLEYFGLFGIF